jgi:branched-chain amino acid transport system permease protein
MHFKPLAVVPWLLAWAALWWLAPGAAVQTWLAQWAVAALLGLGFNLLWSQAGLLSFGHALYAAVGAYAVAATLALVPVHWPQPALWAPVLGGAAAALLAAVLGAVSSRRGGLVFAMMTLGLAELAAQLAWMLPGVFGGEGGWALDRATGAALMGWTLAPAAHLSLCVAVYLALLAWAMHALPATPLGLLLRALRDNPTRVAALGFDPRRLRWLALVLAAGVAGVAGGLGVLVVERATPELFATPRSASVVMFTLLGGSQSFVGPLWGAALMVLAQGWLATHTPAWPLDLALALLLVVLWLPGGLAQGLAWLTAPVAWRRPWRALGRLGAAVLGVAGLSLGVELLYQWPRVDELGWVCHWLGVAWRIDAPASWLAAASTVAVALAWGRALRQSLPSDARPAQTPPSPPAAWSALAPEGASRPLTPGVGAGLPPAGVLELHDLGYAVQGMSLVSGVSLRLPAGERLGLVGPNGAGKTTLLELLSGRLRPTQGSLRWAGVALDGLPLHRMAQRGVARSFQISQLCASLSPREHLRAAALAARGLRSGRVRGWWRWGNPALDAFAADWLAALGLAGVADEPVRALSYADQRVLELGLALAMPAGLVLLDEPTAGLSQAQAGALMALVQRLARGRTLIVIEHDWRALSAWVDRVAVMAEGRLIAVGEPDQIWANPRVRSAYLEQSC